jgi:hypothetical protein
MTFLLVGAAIVSLVVWATLRLCRVVAESDQRLEAVQGARDTPHQAETRDLCLRGGEGIGFSERIALCNQLDEIIALPEADVPALAEWEDR